MHPTIKHIFRFPSKKELATIRAGASTNPLKLFATLTPLTGALFFCGWYAWFVDSADIFALSVATTRMSQYFGFGKSNHQIMLASTVSTLFRPLGAAAFGLASDRYGRKWPYVVNLLLLATCSLATACSKTYLQFLLVRAAFGVGAGGTYGLSVATGVENLEPAARGLFSGILQEAFSLGYIAVAICNIVVITAGGGPECWQPLFFFGAGASLLGAIIRIFLPESPHFLQEKAKRGPPASALARLRASWQETKWVLRNYWGKTLYGTFMIVALALLARATSELYPVMLSVTKGLDQIQTSLVVIISCMGSVVGGILGGWTAGYIGHRYTVIVSKLLTGALIPAWILPTSASGLAAGGFFLHIAAHGGTGTLPVLLSGLSPPQYRATMTGLMLQAGVMLSSFTAPATAAIGERVRVPNPDYTPENGMPRTVPDYVRVSAVFAAICAGVLVLFTLLGPDYACVGEQRWGVGRGGEPEEEEPNLGHTAVGQLQPQYIGHHQDEKKDDDDDAKLPIYKKYRSIVPCSPQSPISEQGSDPYRS